MDGGKNDHAMNAGGDKHATPLSFLSIRLRQISTFILLSPLPFSLPSPYKGPCYSHSYTISTHPINVESYPRCSLMMQRCISSRCIIGSRVSMRRWSRDADPSRPVVIGTGDLFGVPMMARVGRRHRWPTVGRPSWFRLGRPGW